MKLKRAGALLLALMMLVSLFSMPVRAEGALPSVELTEENTATLTCGDYTVRRVYYGWLGQEDKLYTDWETFKANVGDTFIPDYAPKEGSSYALEKAGYYQFVVNYLNGKRRADLAFTVKVEADQAGAVAPTMEGGVLHFNQSTVRKVYYGYVGAEAVEYTDWSSFKKTAGETLTADFAPADGKEYLLTREGYYQFVVQYAWGNAVRDAVFTAKVEKNAVPVISNTVNNNLAVLHKGKEDTVKVYYAYLGETAEASLKWADFRALESFTADYGVPDGKAYLLQKKGVYQFVVSYKNAAGTAHDLTYLVKVDAAAEEPAIQAVDGGFMLHHNSAVRVNKIYVGYMGEDTIPQVKTWEEYQTSYVSSYGVVSPADGATFSLSDLGYYVIVIDYYDGLTNRNIFIRTVKGAYGASGIDAKMKYDPLANPLITESKKINTGVTPSFDIAYTGFVKNVANLSELKGKTLTMIIPRSYGVWNYVDETGAEVDELGWFEKLKEVYGLNVKYITSNSSNCFSQALTYMNAGKALDVIPSCAMGLPLYLNLSQPLDPYVHVDCADYSAGIDTRMLQATRYGGGYRMIAPLGVADVLLYNRSLVEEYGLQDPHKLWQADRWDWNTWKGFLTSTPSTTSDGKALAAIYVEGTEWSKWPVTNGVSPISINTESESFALNNQWMDERVISAMEYYTDVIKSIQNSKDTGANMNWLYDGALMMGDTRSLFNDSAESSYAQYRRYSWVPYPKANTESGQYAAFSLGDGMMLPKVVKTKSNIPYAIKFMELWATRYTEAFFDRLATVYDWGFDERAEYFSFVTQNTYVNVRMMDWRYTSGDNAEILKGTSGLTSAIYDRTLDYKTIHGSAEDAVKQAIADMISYAT